MRDAPALPERICPELSGRENSPKASGSHDSISSEAGYTVAEAAVALALLTAVLLPAITLLAKSMAHSSSVAQVVALSVARTSMERSLGEMAFEDASWQAKGGQWKVERHVESNRYKDLITITITVRDSARGPAVAVLTTQRRKPAATSHN